jgi:predicted hydrocarbon binding protein
MVAVRVEADSPYKVAKFWEHASKVGATVLGSMMNVHHEGVTAYGILDVTGVGAEGAEETLRSAPIEGLRAEVVGRSVMGFVGVGGHVLKEGNPRVVVMFDATLRGLFVGARRMLGDDVGAAFLYHAGLMSGREMGEVYARYGLDPRTALRAFAEAVKSNGYATDITILEGKDRYRIETRNLIECDLLSGYAAERGGHMRTSHWARGYVAGLLSTLRGGEWDVEEVECINDGSDRCAFEARRK